MYPAATVILARAILREDISLKQWLGVFFCLVAVGLIAV
jgi:drug/metabolite transporter (DMT)-like permease